MAAGQCPSSVYQRVSGDVKTQSVKSEKASAAMNEFRGSARSFLSMFDIVSYFLAPFLGHLYDFTEELQNLNSATWL